jgi:sulfonate transport system permease protein
MNVKSLADGRFTVREIAPRARRRLLHRRRIVLPLIFPAAVLLAWQVAASNVLLPVQILPAPSMVLSTLVDLIRSGDMAANLKISLWRVTSGFALGASAGLVFGIMLGASETLDQYLGPSFRALAQIPSLGWVPILILIFGLDEILKVAIIAKACFIPIVLATSQGIRNIPRPYLEVARVLRLRRRALLFKLFIPAALPTIFSGVRLALSHAWIALIVVEMLAATEGVGYIMVWGRTLFQIDIVIAGMIVIGAIGLLMDSGLTRIERYLSRWVPDHV